PQPYDTQCVDYQALGHVSRDYCIMNCTVLLFRKLEFFHNRKGYWPLEYPLPVSLDLRRKYCDVKGCGSEEKFTKYYKKCSKDCKESDCDTKYLERSILHKSASKDRSSILFHLKAFNAPYVEYIHQPQESISALIANIGGTLGLWLGISFADLNTIIVGMQKLYNNLGNIHCHIIII